MLATAAIWLIVAVAVTIPGVRHYECGRQFQLLAWFFRPVWWMMFLALVVAVPSSTG